MRLGGSRRSKSRVTGVNRPRLVSAGVPAEGVKAGQGLPAQMATRVLGISESGYYEYRGRGPSAREVAHALFTDVIRERMLPPAAPTERGGRMRG